MTLAANETQIRARLGAYTQLTQALAEKPGAITPTSEQNAIWRELVTGDSHMIVEAGPGTGKSFTVRHGLTRLAKIDSDLSIAVIAFNVHIAKEMTASFEKMGVRSIASMTCNSYGMKACRLNNPRVTVNRHKIADIVTEMFKAEGNADGAKFVAGPMTWVLQMLRSYLLPPSEVCIRQVMLKHGKMWADDTIRKIVDLAPEVAHIALFDDTTVDFSDQIYMPLQLGWALPQYDVLAVDESQDIDAAQMALLLRACEQGRTVWVGDPKQAIYAFRGAGSDSMQKIEDVLSVTDRRVCKKPLTLTQRCPKSNVRLAQSLWPNNIKALDHAPEGRQIEMPEDKAIDSAKPGDLILCRINAPLVRAAFRLLTAGKKAVLRGKSDIGDGLTALIKKLKSPSIPALMADINKYRAKEVTRLLALGVRGEQQLLDLNDKLDCLVTLATGANSIEHLNTRIEKVFADFEEDGTPRHAVVLGSIHRTKGLEASTVIILNPELMPFPKAISDEAYEQELHLLWIACTRTKFTADDEGTTIWCGKTPSILMGGPKIAHAQTDYTDQFSQY